MRGAFILLTAGLSLAHAAWASPDNEPAIHSVVQQKAAAVAIVRTKAKKFAASLAQGRLFSAYLTAATTSESERLKSRILSTFKALEHRYGLRAFTVVARDGELFAHVGAKPAADGPRNVKKDPLLVQGFAQPENTVTTKMDEDAVTYISPVVRNGEKEFVLSIEQDLTAYEKVLANGLGKNLYVVIIDPSGVIISDSHGAENAGKKAIVAGLSFEDLKKEIAGTPTEGAGVISKDNQYFNVSYQSVDDWTVVAIESTQPSSACLRNGNNSCQ